MNDINERMRTGREGKKLIPPRAVNIRFKA